MGAKKRKVASEKPAQDVSVNPERLAAARLRRNKLILTWAIVVVALLLVGLILLQLRPSHPPETRFAECLTARGAVMYGTDLCPHCQEQKQLFGPSFAAVMFENCDHSAVCRDKNISAIPTWILADGSRLVGTQPLEALAAATGCTLK